MTISKGPVEAQLRALREQRWRELHEPSKPEAVPVPSATAVPVPVPSVPEASAKVPNVALSAKLVPSATVPLSATALSATSSVPWIAEGISRRTWFRRKAALTSASSAA
jgi:hypothetical protein